MRKPRLTRAFANSLQKKREEHDKCDRCPHPEECVPWEPGFVCYFDKEENK